MRGDVFDNDCSGVTNFHGERIEQGNELIQSINTGRHFSKRAASGRYMRKEIGTSLLKPKKAVCAERLHEALEGAKVKNFVEVAGEISMPERRATRL